LLWSPARISFPIFPSGHPDRGPDLAPLARLAVYDRQIIAR
jgi:hypothetical protein